MTYTSTIAEAGGDMQAVIETAIASVGLQELNPEKLYGVTRVGGGHQVVDLRDYRDRPDRKTGSVELSTVDAFMAYIDQHITDGTTVWVHPTSGNMGAILDDHSHAQADWGQHRAGLALIPTEEWKRWKAHDGQLLDQVTFAEHIEDSQLDIVKPDAAELLEIAQTFHGTTNATWRSSQRLADGSVQFAYHEEVEASAGQDGDLEVPSTFELLIRPFVGEAPVALTARLRFRQRSGQLTIGYKLDRPEDVIRDVIEQIRVRLSDRYDHTYVGSPRS